MTAPHPIDAATMLRSEQRERLAQALEALVTRLAPDLARLDVDSLAAILSVELVRVVEGVQAEALHELAEIATAREA